MDFDEAADELYAAQPGEFVATRTRLAKAADPDLAKKIKELRKPSVSAWVVNMLPREAPEAVAAVLAAGSGLRAAWAGEPVAGDLAGWERQRHSAVADAVRTAGELAERHGQPFRENIRREVEETLQAAVVDEAVAAELRAGRLTKPHSHVGFAAPGGLGPATPAPPPPKPAPKKHAEDPRLRLRRLEVAAEEAARAAAEAARTHDEWVGAAETADREYAEAEAEAERLRREYAEARDRAEAARKHREIAHRDQDKARRAADSTRRAAETARHKAEAARTPS
jgi:hypothetical protein